MSENEKRLGIVLGCPVGVSSLVEDLTQGIEGQAGAMDIAEVLRNLQVVSKQFFRLIQLPTL